GALSFDERVDGDGRAVDQLVDGGGGKGALADAVDDALPELSGGGEALGLREPTVGVVEADEIGEGASNIDGDNEHAWRLQRTASKACAAPGTRSGFQRCAGLPHRASHGQALENQRYFGKRQGPQETANADVANGCGDDLFAACGGARARGELPEQTG